MKIGLFIPCFVNAVYPQVGTASFKLLRSLGVDVDYPLGRADLLRTAYGQRRIREGRRSPGPPHGGAFQRL